MDTASQANMWALLAFGLATVGLFVLFLLAASSLTMIAAGARWGQPDGQVMFFFILALASVEVSVGPALAFRLYHHRKSLDADRASSMRGLTCRP